MKGVFLGREERKKDFINEGGKGIYFSKGEKERVCPQVNIKEQSKKQLFFSQFKNCCST